MEITIKRNTEQIPFQCMPYPNLTIKNLLIPFKEVLKEDYVKYKNHVCRVFLNCLHLDKDKDNMEKYAIVAVFHDIGIWTDFTFDYIHPSIQRLKVYLAEHGKDSWEEELINMIYWHHKLSKYKGVNSSTVEIFRKADLMDISKGIFCFGGNRGLVKMNRYRYPNAGFHLFLLKATIKNMFRHPLNVLPMYRW